MATYNHSTMQSDTYLTCRDISTQFPLYALHAHSQVHAQKCNDRGIAFIAAFIQKTQLLTVMLSPNHTQTQAVQHTHRHTHTK